MEGPDADEEGPGVGSEECLQRLDEIDEDNEDNQNTGEKFKLLAGSPEGEGLFIRLSEDEAAFASHILRAHCCSLRSHMATVNNMSTAFSEAKIDDGLLAKTFLEKMSAPSSWNPSLDQIGQNGRIFSSLAALSSAAALYDCLPSATIDVRSLQTCIGDMSWASDLQEQLDPETELLSLASSFACIAAFESGKFNLRPDQLTNVMAMSSGDSIFVAEQLLTDPVDSPWLRHSIRRVPGNIGRAGIAFLVPPREPLIKSFDEKEWQLINHEEFDGKITNCFASTSLHLRFTKAEILIDTGFTGGQDVEAFFIEAVVSVHDGGEWVADLDILKALESELLMDVYCRCALSEAANERNNGLVAASDARSYNSNTQSPESQGGSPASNQSHCSDEKSESELGLPKSPDFQQSESQPANIPGSEPFADLKITEDFASMISLDSWAEILTAPPLPGVIRADRNWQARLAAVAVCVSRGHDTIVLPPQPCWRCAIGMVGRSTTWEQSGPITMVVA